MRKLSVLVLMAFFASTLVYACSDFVIKAKDKSVVVGRSMEFPIDLKSEVVVAPRGQQFNVVNKKGTKGESWTSKYGYFGINAFNLADTYVEGLNEKGLAFDGLMFTGAEYQPATPGNFVPLDKFCAWTMGNFASVDEVKEALKKTNIAASEMDKIKSMGMHVAVHDATGKNIVIEFIGGKTFVYDNPLGVMTNRPSFDWQMNNLRNYINLDSHDKNPKMINGVKIEPTGVGNGMLGMPGDWTPPSRFVRMALAIDAALPPKNAAEAFNLVEHILNIVDIPKGVIKESTPVPFMEIYGIAQWAIAKDLTNKVLYYKTYENTAWKSVDLNKFDLTPGAPKRSIAIDDKTNSIIDVSGQLQ
ncbi:MAG: choloylglycine hydrolase family protein [Candidatus Margulisiibacteriota bacterium]